MEINDILNTPPQSINEAYEQNALLTEFRAEIDITTTEGVASLKQVNAKIDANNEFIRYYADAALKQKMNIGNYNF